MPAFGLSVASSHVQPSRFITGTSPPKVPPAGATATVVMPLARATGMASLSAWYSTRVRSCGFRSSISSTSSYPRTPGSPIPIVVRALMKPG